MAAQLALPLMGPALTPAEARSSLSPMKVEAIGALIGLSLGEVKPGTPAYTAAQAGYKAMHEWIRAAKSDDNDAGSSTSLALMDLLISNREKKGLPATA